MIFSDGRMRRSAAARAFLLFRIASSGFGITSDMTPSRHARAGRPLVFPPPSTGGLFYPLPETSLLNHVLQPTPHHPDRSSTRITLKSLTFVSVGPVTSKSPSRS